MGAFAGPSVFPDYFADPSGNPQESVSITVYNRGTTVKPTIYTDRTKATTLANPFTADSLGNAVFFADAGEYDALVNGVTLKVSVPVDRSDVSPADPVVALTYNADGSVATSTEDGVVTTYTYNDDGTVATTARLGVTRTYTYEDGLLTGVA